MPASTTRKAAWLILQAWGGIEEYIHPLERTFAREIPTSSKFRELPHNASELADGRPRNWEEASYGMDASEGRLASGRSATPQPRRAGTVC